MQGKYYHDYMVWKHFLWYKLSICSWGNITMVVLHMKNKSFTWYYRRLTLQWPWSLRTYWLTTLTDYRYNCWLQVSLLITPITWLEVKWCTNFTDYWWYRFQYCYKKFYNRLKHFNYLAEGKLPWLSWLLTSIQWFHSDMTGEVLLWMDNDSGDNPGISIPTAAEAEQAQQKPPFSSFSFLACNKWNNIWLKQTMTFTCLHAYNTYQQKNKKNILSVSYSDISYSLPKASVWITGVKGIQLEYENKNPILQDKISASVY